MDNNVNRTNQEKRGAKEAYAKVKVEVAALEAEVEELKDVLQVLKASKADKEALEGGDINNKNWTPTWRPPRHRNGGQIK